MSWKRQQTKQVFQCACRPRGVVSFFLPAVRRRVRYTVKGRLFGDVWTVRWPGDREMGIFHERSTVFLSAKISCLFPLPRGSSCPCHASLECDVWVDGSSWASSVTFCVPEIFKVSWDKQNSIGLPLCGWRGLSPFSGLSCPLAQVWCAQHHSPGRQHPSVRDDILHGICWHPPARSDGTKLEGPIYLSHSRKINLHLILSFPILTFKAI